MGCVQAFAVNDFNFLRWHPAAGVVMPFAVPLSYCQPVGTACSLYLAPSDQDFPTLPVVDGDRLRFFINSAAAIDITAGFASVGLGLVQNGVLVQPNVGNLYSLPGPLETNFFIYGDLLIDCLDDGLYWPVIYDLADKHILLIANPVEVQNLQDWQAETAWVKYRHKSALFGVPYGTLPGLYQEFRLTLSMFQPKYPIEDSTYTDRNNRTRTTSLGISRTYDLQTDFWDQGTFDAATVMLIHSDVLINGIQVKAQGGLDPEYQEGKFWITARGKVTDQNFARTVLTC